jgi:hypothetical protein
MSANFKIDVLHNGITTSTPAGNSTDIARKGDTITCTAVDVANTYSWSLVFTPDFSNGDPSASALINPPGSQANSCKFIIDAEGAYMVRLVVDAGLPTENTVFLRVRYETVFGDVKLVSAGERRDQTAVIPADIDPVGWADDQNQNMQKILAYVRRLSTSGRVLYVDANRGRTYDPAQAVNDPTNTVQFPGDDPANLEQTGIFTGAEGFGDFSSIQEAIDYANAAGQAGARSHESPVSSTSPFYVIIRPGLYVEDLNFQPYVHLIGLPDINTSGTWGWEPSCVRIQGHHTWSAAAAEVGSLRLKGLSFTTDPVVVDATPLLTVTGAVGAYQTLYIDNSYIYQAANGGGHAIHLTGAGAVSALISDGRIGSTADDPAKWIILNDCQEASSVFFERVRFYGLGVVSGVRLGAGLGVIGFGYIKNCRFEVMALHNDAHVLSNDLAQLTISGSYFEGFGANPPIVLHHAGNAHPVDMRVTIRDTQISRGNDGTLGDISFNTDGLTSGTLQLGSVKYNDLVFPGANPPTYGAIDQSLTTKYEKSYDSPFTGVNPVVPVAQQLPADNVQDALDALTQMGTQPGVPPIENAPPASVFGTLHSAYQGWTQVANGLIAGLGDGRRIDAIHGSVQISGAATSAPPTANGGLLVEGRVRIGPIDPIPGYTEIDLNPDPFSAGPKISLGENIWINGRGTTGPQLLPSTFIQANSTGSGATAHNYNLTIQTSSSAEASLYGRVGNLNLRAGDSIEPTVVGPIGGNVNIEAGSYLSATAGPDAGYINLIPGWYKNANVSMPVVIGTHVGSTFTVVEAQTPLPAVLGNDAAGSITFATDQGEFSVTVAAGMTPAQVLAQFVAATDLVTTSLDVNDKLTLTSSHPGSLGDIYYLYDVPTNSIPGSVNFALGNFGTQAASSYLGNAITITNVSQANPAIITTANPHGLVADDSVTISGCNVVGLNSPWVVVAVVGDTFEVAYDNAAGPVGNAGTVGKTAALSSAGAAGNAVSLTCTGTQQLKVGSGANSIILDGDTGKLTVPGLIDPTGVIFKEVGAANVPTGANEGAIFVSDGTAPAGTANALYYKHSNGGAVQLLGGGVNAWDGQSGANPSLGGDLVTGGNDITATGNDDLAISTLGGGATGTLQINGAGTGGLVLSAGAAFQWPSAHPANAGDVLSSDAVGNLSWIAPGGVNWNLTSGAAPQLGGNLDVSTHSITTTAVNGDITITPNGTGFIDLGGKVTIPNGNGVNGDILSTDGAGNLTWIAPGGGGAGQWAKTGAVVHPLIPATDIVTVGSSTSTGDGFFQVFGTHSAITNTMTVTDRGQLLVGLDKTTDVGLPGYDPLPAPNSYVIAAAISNRGNANVIPVLALEGWAPAAAGVPGITNYASNTAGAPILVNDVLGQISWDGSEVAAAGQPTYKTGFTLEVTAKANWAANSWPTQLALGGEDPVNGTFNQLEVYSTGSDADNSFDGNKVTVPKNFAIGGAQQIKRTAVAANYGIVDDDYLLGVDTSGGSWTITFPKATDWVGRVFVIKDEANSAGGNPIVGQPDAGEQIENGAVGAAFTLVAINGGAVQIYSNGSNWFIF